MLTIYTTADQLPDVQAAIQREERLHELLNLQIGPENAHSIEARTLIVDQSGIRFPIDWNNLAPPYLLPAPLPFSPETLLGIIFSQLGNGEKAWTYLQGQDQLLFELGAAARLQHHLELEPTVFPLAAADEAGSWETYRTAHNAAVVRHYGYLTEAVSIESVQQSYLQAIQRAPDAAYRAFSTRHFAAFLLDRGAAPEAAAHIEQQLDQPLGKAAVYSLKRLLADAWMQQLTAPYDQELLGRLKETLWEVLQYYEARGQQLEVGLILVDATHIANISESFSEGLGYIQRAIRIFAAEGLEELTGQAELRKGTLLYTWAQHGQPQFYKPAVDSYQRALKVFTQEVTPDVFADIHHQLAVLYSEMPAENKKRGIWAGVASASFQEALQYYTKKEFPYQYGMICNNYGNALTKFPPAIHSDNFEKALYYYQEALDVRTPDFPYERAISLLNYLQASWQVSNDSDALNQERYADMVAKAREVLNLVGEESMLAEARKHLQMLEELKQLA